MLNHPALWAMKMTLPAMLGLIGGLTLYSRDPALTGFYGIEVAAFAAFAIGFLAWLGCFFGGALGLALGAVLSLSRMTPSQSWGSRTLRVAGAAVMGALLLGTLGGLGAGAAGYGFMKTTVLPRVSAGGLDAGTPGGPL